MPFLINCDQEIIESTASEKASPTNGIKFIANLVLLIKKVCNNGTVKRWKDRIDMKIKEIIFKLSEIRFFMRFDRFVIKFCVDKLFMICRVKKKIMAGKIKLMNKIIMSEIKNITGLKIFDEEILPEMKVRFIINGTAELIRFIRSCKKFLVSEKEFLKIEKRLLMIMI